MRDILICSTNDNFLTALRSASGEGEFRITVCRRPMEAVRALMALSFDRLILDLETPGLDSLFLVSIARRINPHLPVVAISSRPVIEGRAVQQKGVAFHLVPPTANHEIAQMITLGVEELGSVAGPAR